MNPSLILFLINLLSNLDRVLEFIIIIGFLLFIPNITIHVLCEDEMRKDEDNEKLRLICKKNYKTLLLVLIPCLLLLILIPDESTMYLMTATSYINHTNIPIKVQQAIELKLDDEIAKLKDKDKK